MKVQPIYTNKIFKKTLEFAAHNSTLFTATASLALSAIARPIAIMATPKTDKENKKYACAKSLSSSLVGYVLMLGVSTPIAKALANIDKKPSKYLKTKTIQTLKAGEKSLSKSKQFTFATQLFNLGAGFLIAAPKSIMTCALIPSIMSKIFPKKDKQKNKDISFTGLYKQGTETLSKGIGKLLDTKVVQKMSKNFHNTNFEQHIISLTDAAATTTFIAQTSASKKIEEDRKKALMYNAGISTGLCIGGGYALSKALDKSTQKFIKNFTEANKNSPKLEKYLEGIRIAKPTMILGGIYYIIIPIISTFLADRFDKRQSYKRQS